MLAKSDKKRLIVIQNTKNDLTIYYLTSYKKIGVIKSRKRRRSLTKKLEYQSISIVVERWKKNR